MAEVTPMIRLEHIQKRFLGQQQAAVDDLSLDILPGEVVTLLGPSGCGKTTTLRLINRLIEPSAGRIFLEGKDVTHVDPDQLRRRIGYVIQQVGLFPHLSIGENIAMTPRLLGWPKGRMAKRVDELLDLIGLEPGMYRDRYPKQLSGGQQQRVGVARALAADPPVMLMDEPFGAIDPITREHLQDEFLSLQDQLHKTVVFVTHDIHEAVKMGTRIALFREQGRLEQYDSPRELLAHPSTSFVADFIGPGASVRLLALTHVGDILLGSCEVLRNGESRTVGGSFRALRLDSEGRPREWLFEGRPAGIPIIVRQSQSLYDALDLMLGSQAEDAVVVDDHGIYVGVLPIGAFSSALPARIPEPTEVGLR